MKTSEFRKHPEISPGRKALYYAGMGLVGLGIILFLGGFLSAVSSFGDFGRGWERLPRGFSLPFIGVVLVIIGGFLRAAGARGLAGSGILLDPEKAREDLHPYTHAVGGMVQDAVKGFRESSGDNAPAEGVKVRCPHCRALNDETAKFCGQCGQAL